MYYQQKQFPLDPKPRHGTQRSDHPPRPPRRSLSANPGRISHTHTNVFPLPLCPLLLLLLVLLLPSQPSKPTPSLLLHSLCTRTRTRTRTRTLPSSNIISRISRLKALRLTFGVWRWYLLLLLLSLARGGLHTSRPRVGRCRWLEWRYRGRPARSEHYCALYFICYRTLWPAKSFVTPRVPGSCVLRWTDDEVLLLYIMYMAMYRTKCSLSGRPAAATFITRRESQVTVSSLFTYTRHAPITCLFIRSPSHMPVIFFPVITIVVTG